MDWITNADFKILYFIHDNLSCGFMDFIMPKITYLTEMGAVWILAALLFLDQTRIGEIILWRV